MSWMGSPTCQNVQPKDATRAVLVRRSSIGVASQGRRRRGRDELANANAPLVFMALAVARIVVSFIEAVHSRSYQELYPICGRKPRPLSNPRHGAAASATTASTPRALVRVLLLSSFRPFSPILLDPVNCT